MSTRVWDVILVLVALLAAGASARYYVIAVIDGDRLLGRLAAAACLFFSVGTLLYCWRFW